MIENNEGTRTYAKRVATYDHRLYKTASQLKIVPVTTGLYQSAWKVDQFDQNHNSCIFIWIFANLETMLWIILKVFASQLASGETIS